MQGPCGWVHLGRDVVGLILGHLGGCSLRDLRGLHCTSRFWRTTIAAHVVHATSRAKFNELMMPLLDNCGVSDDARKVDIYTVLTYHSQRYHEFFEWVFMAQLYSNVVNMARVISFSWPTPDQAMFCEVQRLVTLRSKLQARVYRRIFEKDGYFAMEYAVWKLDATIRTRTSELHHWQDMLQKTRRGNRPNILDIIEVRNDEIRRATEERRGLKRRLVLDDEK